MSSPNHFRAAHYRTGETFDFTFRDGKLTEQKAMKGRTDLLFGPGFFDLQNNGYAGVDFNHPTLTPERAAEGIRGMWQHGCTHVLPPRSTQQAAGRGFLLRAV